LDTNEVVNKIIAASIKGILYTDRAERDIKRAHFTEELIKKLLFSPRKVEEADLNTYILYGKKTARLKVEITAEGSLLIHWFEYNKVAFLA